MKKDQSSKCLVSESDLSNNMHTKNASCVWIGVVALLQHLVCSQAHESEERLITKTGLSIKTRREGMLSSHPVSPVSSLCV